MTTVHEGRGVWDLVLTVVLGLLLLAAAAVGALLGLLLALVGDSCGASVQCSTGQLTAGVVVAAAGPAVVAVIAIIVLVRRLVRRRLAFWVPLVGLAAAVAVWFGGAALAVAAVPGFTV